jgi:threonine aldolase
MAIFTYFLSGKAGDCCIFWKNFYLSSLYRSNMDRRKFIKRSGWGAWPFVAGSLAGLAFQQVPIGDAKPTLTGPERLTADPERPSADHERFPADPGQIVRFTRDGLGYSPEEYVAKLAEINKNRPIKADSYGSKGTVDELLKKFTEITGKEAAFYMPSGTLANQLAIQVLSAANTKVLVQETSHVFRDEGDATQSIYGKRLVPLAKGMPSFTLEDLQREIAYDAKEEYFKTGIGAISIEIPVRRNENAVFPIGEIKRISAWCREKGYKLHLDGARLHIAAMWSGVSVKEYASHFDTVYMCLYKYLGASSGAVLCGDKAVIDPMEHLVKVHGGSMYQNWANAAMALYQLDGIEDRYKATREKAERLFKALNQLQAIQITPLPEGSNVFYLRLGKGYDGVVFCQTLREKHGIWVPTAEPDGFSRLRINESLLLREDDAILRAFQEAMAQAKT